MAYCMKISLRCTAVVLLVLWMAGCSSSKGTEGDDSDSIDDTTPQDSSSASDSDSVDSNGPDTNTADTQTPDSNSTDTAVPDTNTADTNTVDTNMVDTNTVDTHTADTNTVDTNTADTNAVDTATETTSDSATETGSDTATETTGIIRGTVVVQNNGGDMAGVTVRVVGTELSRVTEADGSYEFLGMTPGVYSISAVRSGYESNTSNPFQVNAGQTTTVPELTLAQLTGGLSGRFLLEGQTAHDGITVTIDGTSKTTTTKVNGDWTIPNVSAGNYSVTASKSQYVTKVVSDQQVLAGTVTTVPQQTLDLGATEISGVAELSDDTDHSGIVVTATLTTDTDVTFSQFTNASGAYAIPGLAPGTWSVVASKDGYVSQTEPEVVASVGAPAEDVDFTLIPAVGNLSGVAELEEDTDYTQIEVSIMVDGTKVIVNPDANGNWKFTDIPIGTYQVIIDAPGYVADSVTDQTVTVGVTTIINVTIVLQYDNSPASLEIVSGNNQTGLAGEELEEPLVVRVLNADGLPINANLDFQVASANNGILTQNGTQNFTGQAAEDTGLLAVNLALGTNGATNQVTVLADEVTPVVFTATGTIPTVATLGAGVNNQSAMVGATLGTTILATIKDGSGNAIEGVPVKLVASNSGSTTAGNAVVYSDADGEVSADWTLGGAAGSQSLSIQWAPSLAGVSPMVLGTVNATAQVASCSVLERVSPDVSVTPSGPVGRPMSDQLVVRARDGFGNLVPSATVVWSFASGEVGTINGELEYEGSTSGLGLSTVTAVAGEVKSDMTVTASGCGDSIDFTVQGTSTGTLSFVENAPTATVGTPLVGGLSFTLLNGVAPQVGVQVDVTITSSDGNALVDGVAGPVSIITDETGSGSFTYVQGENADATYTVRARVKGSGPYDDISIGATADVAAAITATGGDNQTGMEPCENLSAFEVNVVDQYDNPVDGAMVTFLLNNGSIGTDVTDENGDASLSGKAVSCTYPSNLDYEATVTGVTSSASFNVTVTPVSPAIATISPDSFNVKEAVAAVTVSGSNFRSWSTVLLHVDGNPAVIDVTPAPTSSTTSRVIAIPGGALTNCTKPTIEVVNYTGSGGSATIQPVAMYNVATLEYDRAWPGFAMTDMEMEGFGIDVATKAMITAAGDSATVLIDDMTVDSTDETLGTVDLTTTGLSAGNTYDFYLVDTSSELCEPISFKAEYMWPDTGQTDSYADYDDGWYLPAPNQKNYTDNGDDTVTDNVTGMTWTKCMAGTDGTSACSNATLQGMSQDDAISYCSNMSFAGHDDWKLPSVKTLMLLQNLNNAGDFIDSEFQGLSTGHRLWSDTISTVSSSYGYEFNYNTPRFTFAADTTLLNVQCVRNELSISGSYTGDSDEFVDLATGLMWIPVTTPAENWENAVAGCENLNILGFDDWRLPSANEWNSLLDYSRVPTLSSDISDRFNVGSQDFYWTSSTPNLNSTKTVVISFQYGVSSVLLKNKASGDSNSYHLFCTRDNNL